MSPVQGRPVVRKHDVSERKASPTPAKIEDLTGLPVGSFFMLAGAGLDHTVKHEAGIFTIGEGLHCLSSYKFAIELIICKSEYMLES